jgi:hypothetical protein
MHIIFNAIFDTPLLPVVCTMAHVLFTLSVFLVAHSGVQHTHYVVFLFCISSSCVPYVANFSGLFRLYCPFSFQQRS